MVSDMRWDCANQFHHEAAVQVNSLAAHIRTHFLPIGEGDGIAEHHTDGVEAGRVLERVKPKLAVFSHYGVDPHATLPLVRRHYAGPVEFGEDSMTIEIGDHVEVRRLGPSR